MMGKFYQEHFPEGFHKLKPEEIKQVQETLRKAFSDDVLNAVFLPMIEAEEENPTFTHPDNWQDLTCLLYTSPSPRDGLLSRMPSSA